MQKEKMKVVLTDSNTLKQIRPKSARIVYERIIDSEIKDLINYLEDLESKGLITIENRIKREGYSYGLYLITNKWYPAVEETSDAIVDIPYGAISINFSVLNPTNKLDINDRNNWDKGYFDLEARVFRVEKNEESKTWKDTIFKE